MSDNTPSPEPVSPPRRRWLRWVLGGVGGLTLGVGLAAVVLPELLHDDLVAALEHALETQVDAEVELGEVELSLLRSFPELSARADGLRVVGTGSFDGVALLTADEAELTVGLWGALRQDYVVHSLSATGAVLDLRLLSDDQASWDIFPTEEGGGADASAVRVDLERITLADSTLLYSDEESGLLVSVSDIALDGEALLKGDRLTVTGQLAPSALSVAYGGQELLKGVAMSGGLIMDAALDSSLYTLRSSTVILNELPLDVTGTMSLLDEGQDLDLAIAAPEADFRAALSLIPIIYRHSFSELEASGDFSFQAAVKGMYTADTMPGFDMRMQVEDGRFGYPDLPGEVTGVRFSARAQRAEGPDLDNTALDISQASASLGGQPFTASLSITDPISDPLIRAEVKTDLDLSRLGELIPLSPDEVYTGAVEMAVSAQGRYSAVTAERYGDFALSGDVRARGLVVETESAPLPVHIDEMAVALSPGEARIDALRARMGRSDASITGTVVDPLGYLLESEALRGSFALHSDLVDLDELYASAGGEGGDEPGEVIAVPDDLDVRLETRIEAARYAGVEARDVRGTVRVAEETATLQDLKMRALGGTMTASGRYSTARRGAPEMDVELKLSGLDISALMATSETAQHLAPVAARAEGEVGASVALETLLEGGMSPLLSSLNGGGTLRVKQGDPGRAAGVHAARCGHRRLGAVEGVDPGHQPDPLRRRRGAGEGQAVPLRPRRGDRGDGVWQPRPRPGDGVPDGAGRAEPPAAPAGRRADR